MISDPKISVCTGAASVWEPEIALSGGTRWSNSFEHALQTTGISVLRLDPFDRIPIARSVCNPPPLLTEDVAIEPCEVPVL